MALKRRKKEEMPKLSKEEQARVDKFVEYLFLAFIILAVICTIIVYKTKNPGMATDYMNSATVEGYYENSFKPYKSLDVTHLNYDVDDLNYEIYFPDDIVGKENQDKLRGKLKNLLEIPFNFDEDGTKIIYKSI